MIISRTTRTHFPHLMHVSTPAPHIFWTKYYHKSLTCLWLIPKTLLYFCENESFLDFRFPRKIGILRKMYFRESTCQETIVKLVSQTWQLEIFLHEINNISFCAGSGTFRWELWQKHCADSGRFPTSSVQVEIRKFRHFMKLESNYSQINFYAKQATPEGVGAHKK